jgi:hypothetical protein
MSFHGAYSKMGERIPWSPVPLKTNAPEPDQWPDLPFSLPREFAKSPSMRKMDGRGGGDRTKGDVESA